MSTSSIVVQRASSPTLTLYVMFASALSRITVGAPDEEITVTVIEAAPCSRPSTTPAAVGQACGPSSNDTESPIFAPLMSAGS